jgi:colanic acid biosynthesis glycosyl transferase WcaI
LQLEGQGQSIVKILLLGINYWPDETGIAPFNTGRCEHLASQGHEVTVCTAPPYYPEWRIPDTYRGSVLTKEYRNGVTILRSWLYVPRQVTAAKRLLHEASFIASSLLNLFRAGRPDLIVVISAPLGLGLTASILSKMWRVPFVFHVEDLQPDAAADLGMMRNRAIIGPLYALERRIYRRADLVTTLTEGMRSRIIAKGIPKEKVSLSTHWSESRLFDIPIRGGANDFRRREGLENAFVVVHAGNMGVKQGLEVVIDAANLTRKEEQIVYLFVGDGASRAALERQTAALSLRNVRFMGVRYGDDFKQVLGAADVCLVTQRRGVAEILFPSKILTILAAARAVLASLGAETEVARVLSESGGALVLEPEDPKVLADAVLSTRENPLLLHRMAVSGRAYAQSRWSRDVALSRMEQQLTSIAARQNYARVSNTAYGENEI